MMMLESMIAAYTMSTMSVDGTRPSEPSPVTRKFSIVCFFGGEFWLVMEVEGLQFGN